MKRGIRKLGTLALLVSINMFSLFGQVERFEAVYIYNICRFVEWPTDMRTGNFVIGVVGESAITSELQKLAASRNILGQSIQVLVFSNPAAITKCHVLFVSPSQSNHINAVAMAAGAASALIVSHHRDGISRGSSINFFMDEERLQFEYRGRNATVKGLKVSAEIERLAAKVL